MVRFNAYINIYRGDTAEIVVHNLMDEETSLHWHGVMLPNKEDGVPWLTQNLLSLIQHIPIGFLLFNTVHTGIIHIPDFRNKLECMVLSL